VPHLTKVNNAPDMTNAITIRMPILIWWDSNVVSLAPVERCPVNTHLTANVKTISPIQSRKRYGMIVLKFDFSDCALSTTAFSYRHILFAHVKVLGFHSATMITAMMT